MSLLVRKIARAKWPDKDYDSFDINKLQADAISVDLKTKGNTLSVWEVENENQLNDAISALVTSAEKIETMHIIFFDSDSIKKCFRVEEDSSTGTTPIERLKEKHRNLCDFDYESLGKFSYKIIEALKNSNMRTIEASKLKELVKSLISDGELDIDKVNPKLREHIMKLSISA